MRKQRGQTLLEVLLALGATTMILGAISTIVISSLDNAQFTKNQNLANSYAREGMEGIRKIRDSSWDNFVSYNGKYCMPNVNQLISSPPGGNCGQNVGIFNREVTIDHSDALCSKVTTTVAWTDGKCPAGTGNIYCHNVKLVSCFSNIDTKPTP